MPQRRMPSGLPPASPDLAGADLRETLAALEPSLAAQLSQQSQQQGQQADLRMLVDQLLRLQQGGPQRRQPQGTVTTEETFNGVAR